jgi:hypothetical protein
VVSSAKPRVSKVDLSKNLGIAATAKMPTIIMTTTSSIRVKPLWLLSLQGDFGLLIVLQGNEKADMYAKN